VLGNAEGGCFRNFKERVGSKQNHSSTLCLFDLSLPSLAQLSVEQAAMLLCWRVLPDQRRGEETGRLWFVLSFEILSLSEVPFLEICDGQ